MSDRLSRLDHRVTRCHCCGAWTFDGRCSTPHHIADEMEQAA